MPLDYRVPFQYYNNFKLSEILAQLDLTLSQLRDSLRGTGDKTLTDIVNQLDITLSQLRDGILGTGNKTLTDIFGQLDLTLSQLRDALRGADNRTLTDLYNKAYDSTNNRIKIKIEDSSIQVPVDVQGSEIAYDSVSDKWKTEPDNPPNLDVALSSRASEDTLTEIKNVQAWNIAPAVDVPSGSIFVVPQNKIVYVSDIFAEGDIYCEGDLLVV